MDNFDHREEEDVVTPYSICNQTNVKLLVKRLSDSKRDSKGDGKKTGGRGGRKDQQSLTVKGGVGSS